MNYMAEVAKLLGVELGEKFQVGNLELDYVLTADGLFYVNDNSRCDHVLSGILEGKISYKRKPYMPKHEHLYWYVVIDGSITSCRWFGDHLDISNYKLGNCYRTKEEAEANRKKWIDFYVSAEVLEV